jgi:hypothetical protein
MPHPIGVMAFAVMRRIADVWVLLDCVNRDADRHRPGGSIIPLLSDDMYFLRIYGNVPSLYLRRCTPSARRFAAPCRGARVHLSIAVWRRCAMPGHSAATLAGRSGKVNFPPSVP